MLDVVIGCCWSSSLHFDVFNEPSCDSQSNYVSPSRSAFFFATQTLLKWVYFPLKRGEKSFEVLCIFLLLFHCSLIVSGRRVFQPISISLMRCIFLWSFSSYSFVVEQWLSSCLFELAINSNAFAFCAIGNCLTDLHTSRFKNSIRNWHRLLWHPFNECLTLSFCRRRRRCRHRRRALIAHWCCGFEQRERRVRCD